MPRPRVPMRILSLITLLLAVLLACAWFMSSTWAIKFNGHGGSWAAVSGGRLWVTLESPPMPAEARSPTGIHKHRAPYRWWFEGTWRPSDKWLAIPLWPLIAGCAGACLLARRAHAQTHRQLARSACPACGYDRSGLAASSNCPECNAPANAP